MKTPSGTQPHVKARRRGYRLEHAIAKYLGLERIAGPGRRDLTGLWLAVETKWIEPIPQWLEQAVCQSERLARPEQLAIVVLHDEHRHHDKDLVVLRLRDFRDWFGGAERERHG